MRFMTKQLEKTVELSVTYLFICRLYYITEETLTTEAQSQTHTIFPNI